MTINKLIGVLIMDVMLGSFKCLKCLKWLSHTAIKLLRLKMCNLK